MNRRGFLKGVIGLAALSAVPVLAGAQTEIERFVALAKTGMVAGQTFHVDGPLILRDMAGLTILQCTFIFHNLADYDAPAVSIESNNICISQCTFDTVDASNRDPDADWHSFRVATAEQMKSGTPKLERV